MSPPPEQKRSYITPSIAEIERSLFKRTLDALPDGVLLTSSARRVLYANREFANVWQIPQGLVQVGDEIQMLNLATSELADPDEFYLEVDRLTLSSESSNDEIRFKDGRIISRRSVPFVEDGEIQARIWIFSDVTEARNASIDTLTGLPNRRAYSREFPQYTRAPDDGFFRAVTIMDVDNFKRYNDIYGHAAGDAVLRQIGAILRSHLANADDMVFRIGGEEFLMACRCRTEADTISFFEALRRSVAATATPHSGNPPHGIVTASFGVGVFRGPLEPGALFENVDAALYEAKATGRNKVAFAALPQWYP